MRRGAKAGCAGGGREEPGGQGGRGWEGSRGLKSGNVGK